MKNVNAIGPCPECGAEGYHTDTCSRKPKPKKGKPMNAIQAATSCHQHCCDCVDRLRSIRDKVSPDVQAVIDQCIADCQACCDDLCHIHQPLQGKAP